jgi:hypothetical protein
MREQQQLFNEDAEEFNVPLEAEFNYSHVHLGSCQCSLRVLTYKKVLEEALALSDFGDSLTNFLRDHAGVEVYSSDFEGDGFKGNQHCISWCKVVSTLFDIILQVD